MTTMHEVRNTPEFKARVVALRAEREAANLQGGLAEFAKYMALLAIPFGLGVMSWFLIVFRIGA